MQSAWLVPTAGLGKPERRGPKALHSACSCLPHRAPFVMKASHALLIPCLHCPQGVWQRSRLPQLLLPQSRLGLEPPAVRQPDCRHCNGAGCPFCGLPLCSLLAFPGCTNARIRCDQSRRLTVAFSGPKCLRKACMFTLSPPAPPHACADTQAHVPSCLAVCLPAGSSGGGASCTYEPGTDLNGGDLPGNSKLSAADAAACCAKCQARADCAAW